MSRSQIREGGHRQKRNYQAGLMADSFWLCSENDNNGRLIKGNRAVRRGAARSFSHDFRVPANLLAALLTAPADSLIGWASRLKNRNVVNNRSKPQAITA